MQNYNPRAREDDGSCIPVQKYCKNPAATNYSEEGVVGDNSLCEWPRRTFAFGGECANTGEFEVEVYPANPTVFNGNRYAKSITVDNDAENFPRTAQEFINKTGTAPFFYLHNTQADCNTPFGIATDNQVFESGKFGDPTLAANKKHLIMLKSTAEPSAPVHPDNATGYVMRRVGGGAPGGCVDSAGVDKDGDGCGMYAANPAYGVILPTAYQTDAFNAKNDCCVCK